MCIFRGATILTSREQRSDDYGQFLVTSLSMICISVQFATDQDYSLAEPPKKAV